MILLMTELLSTFIWYFKKTVLGKSRGKSLKRLKKSSFFNPRFKSWVDNQIVT